MSYNNHEEIKVFPVVPNNIEVSRTQKNEEFETIDSGTINLIGDPGLRTLEINSIFPNQAYAWLKHGSSSDGWSYVNFLEKIQDKEIPGRIVIGKHDGSEWLNMAFSIEKFTHGEMPNGDIRYSLELKEYTFRK